MAVRRIPRVWAAFQPPLRHHRVGFQQQLSKAQHKRLRPNGRGGICQRLSYQLYAKSRGCDSKEQDPGGGGASVALDSQGGRQANRCDLDDTPKAALLEMM